MIGNTFESATTYGYMSHNYNCLVELYTFSLYSFSILNFSIGLWFTLQNFNFSSTLPTYIFRPTNLMMKIS